MIDKWLNQAADWIFILRDRLHRVRKNVAADGDARVKSIHIPSIDDVKKSVTVQLGKSPLRRREVQVGVVAGIVILACLWSLYRHVSPPRPATTYLWYFDLNTGKLIIAADQIPPIPTSSGPHDGQPAGVRAHLFSCGSCSDGTQRTVGYLESFPPDSQAALANPYGYGGIGDNPARGESVIKRVKDTKWVPAASDEGMRIIAAAQQNCPHGSPPKSCDDPYGG